MTISGLPVAFGKVLRKHRKRKGWSQMQLAANAGLHLNALGNLERGEYNPTLETVFLLARALDVPPEQLIGEVSFWLE